MDDLWTPKLEPSLRRAFQIQRAADNIKRIRIVAAILVVVMLGLGAMNAAFVVGTSPDPSPGPGPVPSSGSSPSPGTVVDLSAFPEVAILYPVFFVLNVGVIIGTYLWERRGTAPVRHRRLVELAVSIYVSFVLLLAAAIALASGTEPALTTVYVLTALLVGCLVLTEAWQFAVPLVLSAAILGAGLFVRLQPGAQLLRELEELTLYVLVAFLISRIVYAAYLRLWRSDFRARQKTLESHRLNEKLRRVSDHLGTLAKTDELTGIPNRRGFNVHLQQLLAVSGGCVRLSLVMIDVDYFKEYNDLYGHNQGDCALVTVARVLAKVAAQTSGFVARWGGEEFVYVGVGMAKDDLLDVCRKIHEGILAAGIRHEGSLASPYITVSQGAYSMEVRCPQDIAACMREADRALYLMKSGGRNGFVYSDGATA